MSAEPGMRIDTASLTDVGRVRSHNEDYCDEFQANGHRLLVVADGMGGHKGGATASRVAVETIGEIFLEQADTPVALLQRALNTANERVFHMSMENSELRGMGTTVVAMLFGPGEAWVGHVGDSRAYRLRAGSMEALTADHSVVAEMERRGLLTAEEAAVHPRRNEILRSIGVEPTVDPDVQAVDVRTGDRFLLCSDGLSGMVQDQEIASVLGSESPAIAARILVDLANDLGGTDNVTLQIAAVSGTVARDASTTTTTAHSAVRGEAAEASGFSPIWIGVIGAAILAAAAAFFLR